MPVHDFAGFLYKIELLRDDGWHGDAYPFNLTALKGWDSLKLHPNVTFFVGENGSGKSTLVEAIAVSLGLNAEGGSKDHGFSTRVTHSELHRQLRLVRSPRRVKDTFFLRAESFYTFSSYIDDSGTRSRMGGHALHELSHGQSFFALMENRLAGDGLYIMDEPEAALSPNRQLAFLSRMHQLVREYSQLIIATHSPIILAYPDATIYEVSGRGVSAVAYDDLDHVQVTKSFLNRRQTFLDVLLSDED